YLPYKKVPFDPLIDFSSLQNQDVLEIGTGNGSHAGLLSWHARSFVGIDITDYAVKSTSLRLKRFELSGQIIQMDAERMAFLSNSFDFIWTWGVIHHSSDTEQVLSDMHRVLRPGGRAIVMVYHRSFWNWYMVNGLFLGLFRQSRRKVPSVHSVVQKWTDGAIARYYTIPEWRTLASQFFSVERIAIYGGKPEIVPLPAGRLKEQALRLIPDRLGRFFTNDLKWGVFLVSSLKKEP
ncbi:partial demethylmenaquinone methyltransferase / 2-methoxy-6-polyprenyl-1,4-benzoquinol methylase, partial [Anaerolineae bacterium]